MNKYTSNRLALLGVVQVKPCSWHAWLVEFCKVEISLETSMSAETYVQNKL